MNRFLIFFALIFLISCSNMVGQNNPDLTKSALEGHWKFVTVRIAEDALFLNNYPKPMPGEQTIRLPYIGPGLIFEKDTMYEVEYPIALGKGVNYSVDSHYLHYHFVGHNNSNSYPVSMVNDTLFIYKTSYGGEYLKEGYIKTTFNDSILNIIKRDGANYPELAGTWYLVRGASGDDGSEYLLEFPYEIPDSIKITREEFISALDKNRVYMMSTNGKKRDYVFSYERGYLKFTPGKWYKGEDPWIHLSRKQMEY